MKLRQGKDGKVIGLKSGSVDIVVVKGNSLVKSTSQAARKWFADNAKIISKARTEWENRSDSGRVAKTLFQSEGVSRPARESVHQIVEEVRTTMSDKTANSSEELKKYVGDELEALYNRVRWDIAEMGKDLLKVKEEVNKNSLFLATNVNIELVSNELQRLGQSVDSLLSSNSGEITEDVRDLSKRITTMTTELRRALVEYDESVRKVSEETRKATGERMRGFVKNVSAKLGDLRDTITKGNEEVERLGNVLLEQGQLTTKIEANLNRVIQTVNTLPKSFPSLERVVKVVDDLRKVVLERGNGTNLSVDTTQVEAALNGVTKSLGDLESALTSSMTPLKDEVSELTTALEREVRNIKKVSVERDKEVGKGFNTLSKGLDEQTKATRSVEAKLEELRIVVDNLFRNFPKLEEIRKVISDTESLMAERDQGVTTEKITKLFKDLGTRMDRLEEKVTSTTTPGQEEVSQAVSDLRDELRSLRLALPQRRTEGTFLTRQDIREINGVLSDTITDETPEEVVQARVQDWTYKWPNWRKRLKVRRTHFGKVCLKGSRTLPRPGRIL